MYQLCEAAGEDMSDFTDNPRDSRCHVLTFAAIRQFPAAAAGDHRSPALAYAQQFDQQVGTGWQLNGGVDGCVVRCGRQLPPAQLHAVACMAPERALQPSGRQNACLLPLQNRAVLHIEGGYYRRRTTDMVDTGGGLFTVGTPLSDHATREQNIAFLTALHEFQPTASLDEGGGRLRLGQVQGLTGPTGMATHLRPAGMVD